MKNNRNNNRNNINPAEMQVLTSEALENVSGGGVKEIVAATTLAAMAMTGNTVSAFGLAGALAEENAHIEIAPEQGGQEGFADADILSVDEILPDEDAPVMEAEDVDLDVEDEAVLFAMNAENGDVQASVDEVEFDLDDPDGADQSFIEENPDDPRETLRDLIDMAVEETRDQGVYAALNSTFATLADNAEAISNPETGVIELDGNQIVNMTYDALRANFNNTPEQLMGAIGAAAARADELGFIQRLGGDRALASMAAEESGQKFYNDVVNYSKTALNTMLDTLGLIDPELKNFIPFLKSMVGIMFTTENNFNANVLKKLDDIEAEIQKSEENIKRNAYNVVSLQSIGDRFSTVADKAEQVEEKIGNYMGDRNLTDAQKLQKTADLMESSEFQALESAMNGATKCFTSNVNDIFERQSIFEAAFARASESVMFSGEALTISTPYIIRQFAVYLAAYGVMNQVYNAYEEVYGASSLTATREKMYERLGDISMTGNSTGGTVGAQLKAYFGRSRYDFINRGTANVPLKRGIVVVRIHKDTWYEPHNVVESWARSMPLNQAQVESICSYAAARGRGMFDFLFNVMGFVPVTSPTIDVDHFFPENDPGQWYTVDGTSARGGIKIKLTREIATPCNRILGQWHPNTRWTEAVNGQQAFGVYRDGYTRYITCNTLHATNVGVERRERDFLYHEYDYKKTSWIGQSDTDLMIFVGR